MLVNTDTPACCLKLHEPSIGAVVHIGHPKSFMILVQYVHLTLLSHLALRGGCVGSSIGSGSSIATYIHTAVSAFDSSTGSYAVVSQHVSLIQKHSSQLALSWASAGMHPCGSWQVRRCDSDTQHAPPLRLAESGWALTPTCSHVAHVAAVCLCSPALAAACVE